MRGHRSGPQGSCGGAAGVWSWGERPGREKLCPPTVLPAAQPPPSRVHMCKVALQISFGEERFQNFLCREYRADCSGSYPYLTLQGIWAENLGLSSCSFLLHELPVRFCTNVLIFASRSGLLLHFSGASEVRSLVPSVSTGHIICDFYVF